MIEIRRYTSQDAAEWNQFVKDSRQGTFLFDRNYMDYHQDRFHDHSLMIYAKNHLIAILPANEQYLPANEQHLPLQENTVDTKDIKILISHQGLTYGGLLTSQKVTAEIACDIFEALKSYLIANEFQKLIYKAIPWIYHKIPSEEDLYALIHIGRANLSAREISTTIPLSYSTLQHTICPSEQTCPSEKDSIFDALSKQSIRFSEQRRRGVKKGILHHLSIEKCDAEQIGLFWNILRNNLQERYGITPVHTLEEMQLLMRRFPNHILCYIVRDKEEVVGGTVIYQTPQVVHTQYIAASTKGKEEGALDFLFDYLINQCKWDAAYLDFGKSTEHEGHYLNRNLIHQKEGFGGRGVVYDTYEWILNG